MSSVQGRKALLLGSGFVATPTVEVLSKAGVHVTVACRTLASAKKLSSGFKNTSAVSLDVNNTAALESAVAEHDVVISLIPYTFHATVIKAAIKAKRHVVRDFPAELLPTFDQCLVLFARRLCSI
jgi:saccharopine dehydrogenase (NADP+, L-glutamate forming)